MRETFRARLRRLRHERGLTQRELARLTGDAVSYAYISRLEKGERTASVKAIRSIAGSLGVDPHVLEFGTPNPDRERARSLLELARFWKARARFLERRLSAFEGQETADMGTIAEVLHSEAVIAGQMTVMEAIGEAREEEARTRLAGRKTTSTSSSGTKSS